MDCIKQKNSLITNISHEVTAMYRDRSWELFCFQLK